MTEIWQIDATTLAAAIHAREISARQAAMAALDRLDAVNPRINAVIACRPDDVLDQADAVDAAIIRGDDPGPLAGVPVTVKVNIDQAGFATTNGTKLQEHLIATSNNPVVDNFRRAGAVILGRTNTPAFSLRWFTSNLVHGATKNPRDPALTPGGSSGGAAASLAVGIGHIAHGTDIAGSIRYPAYACGVHGLRPSFGRIPAYNAALPERPLGAQLTSVSGPLARSIADLRLALAVMAAPDARDPWWVPAPLVGPPAPRRVALCLRPDGLAIAPEVGAALLDAAQRLEAAGWTVEAVTDLPPLREAAALQTTFWIGDGFNGWDDLVRRDGDKGAQAVINGLRGKVAGVTPGDVVAATVRRATVLREWQAFLQTYPVVLLPVSAELPFPDDLDLADFNRVWEAQLTMIGLAFLGLPALTVATGLVGTTPVGVQIVAGRFREDLCLAAAEVIEAAGAPPSPIDPV
jgi:amidase